MPCAVSCHTVPCGMASRISGTANSCAHKAQDFAPAPKFERATNYCRPKNKYALLRLF